MKVGERLEQLRRMAPHTSEHGQLYAQAAETRRRFYRVSLWYVLVSVENTHSVHETVFKKAEPLSPAEWAAWFASDKARDALSHIIAHIGLRTGKRWALQKFLGWAGDAEFTARDSAPSNKGHKPIKARGKSGQTNLRRRQRNKPR